MDKTLSKVTAILFLLTLSFLPDGFTKDNSTIQIKGSDTMVNLVQAWAEKFMEKNPDLFVAVTGGGSGTGIAALIGNSCDVAMSSRNITEKERSMAARKSVNPEEVKAALDGLAVVVHPKNPVSQLTLEELALIFSGRVHNWKEVGGSDAKIVVLSREVNSGTHVYFKEHVLRKGDSKSKEEFSPDALLMPSSQAIADEIAQNPDAIGYYGMGYIGPQQKAVPVARDKNSPAIYPKIEDVKSGLYPISRPLFLYLKDSQGDKARRFIDFALSDEGQVIVAQTDFVPIK